MYELLVAVTTGITDFYY